MIFLLDLDLLSCLLSQSVSGNLQVVVFFSIFEVGVQILNHCIPFEVIQRFPPSGCDLERRRV